MSPRVEHIGNQTLVLADCLKCLPTLQSADCFLTDPFYGVDGGRGGQARERGKARYIQSTTEWDDTPVGVSAVAVPAVEWCVAHCERGAVTPGIKCLRLYPEPADEGCFYTPAAMGVGSWGFTSFHPILYYGRDYRAGLGAWSTGMELTEAAEKNGHPCPKPIRAWTWLLRKVSQEGETVLDPFMGSGTTLVACENTGRRGIGIEICPEYFDIACRRVEAAASQPRLELDEPRAKAEQLAMEATL